MATNKMSLSSRIEYLKKVKPRYLKASKNDKSNILNEFCENTGYARKYVIRRLAPKSQINPPKVINRKRRCHYTNEDILWLSKIWEIMDYPCGQRLEPVLPEMIDVLVSFKELYIPESIAEKLIDKKRTGKHGEKIKKIYDKAKTPYQRILECDQIDEAKKKELKEKYKKLNPAELRRSILAKKNNLNKINQPEILIPAKDKVTFTNHSTN